MKVIKHLGNDFIEVDKVKICKLRNMSEFLFAIHGHSISGVQWLIHADVGHGHGCELLCCCETEEMSLLGSLILLRKCLAAIIRVLLLQLGNPASQPRHHTAAVHA